MTEKDDPKLNFLNTELQPFFKLNPDAQIVVKNGSYHVQKVWNDESISFVIETDTQTDLINTLNNLIFPPRFTGIYHVDTNTMEYIYTLADESSSYFSRCYEVIVGGKIYKCRFDLASERLMLLSKQFMPAGKSLGNDRNLTYLSAFAHKEELEKLPIPLTLVDYLKNKKPMSFFVEGFEEFTEEKIVVVSKHINFFSQYYDRQAPVILIHSIQKEEPNLQEQLRFIEDYFPNKINTPIKDLFLLDLCLAANEADIRLAYIYYYQILEYAAHYYVIGESKKEILQILTTPDVCADPEKYIPKILDATVEIKTQEYVKRQNILKEKCSPNIVWREITQNMTYFSQLHEFEGGFKIEPLVSDKTTFEEFNKNWHTTIESYLTKIRNALVHSREQSINLIIAPTRENAVKLKPWLTIIHRIAEQLIIYCDFK